MLVAVGLHDVGHAAVLTIVHFLNLVEHNLLRLRLLCVFEKILFVGREIDPFEVLGNVGR